MTKDAVEPIGPPNFAKDYSEIEASYRKRGYRPTYNEIFAEVFDKNWRCLSNETRPEILPLRIHTIEMFVREAMLSDGIYGLIRHIEVGGYLGPMLSDFLIRHLKGEKNLIPRGQKRTDAQVQKEMSLLVEILCLHHREGMTFYKAISMLLENDPTLNRKNLEGMVSKAKKLPRWGLNALFDLAKGYDNSSGESE